MRIHPPAIRHISSHIGESTDDILYLPVAIHTIRVIVKPTHIACLECIGDDIDMGIYNQIGTRLI